MALGCVAAAYGLVGCGGAISAPLMDAGKDGGPEAPEGSLLVQPQFVDFGDVVVKHSASLTITLTNSSAFDLNITPGMLTGASAQFFSISQTTPFVLKGNSSFPIQATFSPVTPSGGGEDASAFRLSLGAGAPVLISLQGVAAATALQIIPNPIDFGFVQPGGQLTKALQIQNLGNQDVNINSIAVTDPGMGQAFALAYGAPTSVVVLARQSIDVEVVFSPTSAQQYSGELQVASNDSLPLQSITLEGYGGGAAITCMPTKVDFGTAPAGFATTLPVVCTNTGTDILVSGKPDVTAELQISGFQFSPAAGVFTAAIDAQSPQGPLLANQSVLIDVTYTPTGTETDRATLTIVSNVTNPPAPPVLALSGQAIQEQKCYYSLTPTSLNWGQVKPLMGTETPYTQAFTITNLGPNECLVNGVNVLPGSDPAFTVTEIVSQRLSAPVAGAPYPSQLVVPVSFSPVQTGNYNGTVGFTISDPDGPKVQVPLSGMAGASCFSVTPEQLDFGVLGPVNGGYCSSNRGFVASNGCAQSVTLSGLSVTAASDVFSLDAGISPSTLNAGQSASFDVTFTPTVAGAYFGVAQIQTDLQQTPFGIFMSGTLAPSTTWTDQFTVTTPTLDLLWVMDSADSTERQQVANYASDIITSLEGEGIDFQIGVTSTDVCAGAEDGRLVPCDGCHLSGSSVPQVVTQDDPNAAADLATLMGLSGANSDCGSSDEQLFEAAYEALVSGVGAVANNALGFIRPGAYLAVITVNGDNNDDASTSQTAEWYASQFLSIKGSDHPKLFSWSYVNPSGFGAPWGLQPFDLLPVRIYSMLNLVGGVALDTTQAQWDSGLSDLWEMVLAVNYEFSLSGTPDPTSLALYLDGPPPGQVPDGGMAGTLIEATNPSGSWNWQYDAMNNAIELNPQTLSLLSSDTLYVEYTLTCP
jgi:hypothetical protein